MNSENTKMTLISKSIEHLKFKLIKFVTERYTMKITDVSLSPRRPSYDPSSFYVVTVVDALYL